VKKLVPLLVGGALLFGGCSWAEQQQIRDLENVTQTEPDKARLVTNVDGYANIVALCIEGQGFATTTRDYSSLIPVPGWGQEGGWCTR
jgi:hypothetical protein